MAPTLHSSRCAKIKRLMKFLLLVVALFLPGSLAEEEVPSEGIVMEAEAVLRKDLPDGFPILMLNEDFAVLEVRIENRTEESYFPLDVEQIEIYSKKDDLIEKALSTEITPTIVKYYRSKPNAIYAQNRYGTPYPGSYPTIAGVRSMRTIPETGGRKVRATIGQEVREIVESFQLKSIEVPPGHYVDGYIYLKSKDSGNKLSGGHVRLKELRAEF